MSIHRGRLWVVVYDVGTGSVSRYFLHRNCSRLWSDRAAILKVKESISTSVNYISIQLVSRQIGLFKSLIRQSRSVMGAISFSHVKYKIDWRFSFLLMLKDQLRCLVRFTAFHSSHSNWTIDEIIWLKRHKVSNNIRTISVVQWIE